jgi:hypothetical protein
MHIKSSILAGVLKLFKDNDRIPTLGLEFFGSMYVKITLNYSNKYYIISTKRDMSSAFLNSNDPISRVTLNSGATKILQSLINAYPKTTLHIKNNTIELVNTDSTLQVLCDTKYIRTVTPEVQKSCIVNTVYLANGLKMFEDSENCDITFDKLNIHLNSDDINAEIKAYVFPGDSKMYSLVSEDIKMINLFLDKTSNNASFANIHSEKPFSITIPNEDEYLQLYINCEGVVG